MSNVKIQRISNGMRDIPVFEELTRRMDAVRQRAFELFASRGGGDGHDLDDWITAEHDVLGWPAAEFKDADGVFELDVTLPGFASQEIEVTATPSELVVHAASTREQQQRDGEILWSEFGANDVYRRVAFPAPVDADHVSATFRNGLLTVRAPKAAAPSSADGAAGNGT